MKYRLNVNITEKDYLDFNVFWMFASPYGKKQIIPMRIFFAVILGGYALFSLFNGGFSMEAFIGVIPTVIILALIQILFKPMFVAILKGQIKKMKKSGKPGYSENSVFEFYSETFVETTPDNRTEIKYPAVERVSVVEDKIIYVHLNNVMAYLLPVSSFESKEQLEEFLNFLRQKGSAIDVY